MKIKKLFGSGIPETTEGIVVGNGLEVNREFGDPFSHHTLVHRIDINSEYAAVLDQLVRMKYMINDQLFLSLQELNSRREDLIGMIDEYKQEREMREKFPVVANAYNDYKMTLKLCSNIDEEND